MRLILALIASTIIARADITPERANEIFSGPVLDKRCPTFTASAFFQTPVNAETGEVKPAGGISLRAIVWRGWGLQGELIQSAIEDSFLDRAAAHIVYRHPLPHRFAWTGFAGAGRDFEDRETGVEVGAGIEWEWRHVVPALSLRWQKDDTEQHIVVPTLSLGYRF